MAQQVASRQRLGATPWLRERDDGPGRLRLAAVAAGAALVVELLAIPFVSPRFAVREVRLRGDPGVTELVAEQLRLPANMNLLRAPLGELAAQARRVPAVEQVEVARALPNRIVMTVVRREAAAVIRQADRVLLVTPGGVVFRVPGEYGWGLPELVAPHLRAGEVTGREAKRELSELLRALRALDPNPRVRVARLEWVRPERIEATLASGGKVNLGGSDQLPAKVALVAAALDRLGAERVEYLDLSDPAGAYWRPRGARGQPVDGQDEGR